ncbi:MAG: alpha-amylase family glycosyl hydrolase, partial [Myxococcota bacterium]
MNARLPDEGDVRLWVMLAYVGCGPAIVSEAHSGGLRKASLDFRDASGCTAEVRRPGSAPNGDGTTTFSIWAPSARELRISLDGAESPLIAVGDGWFRGVLPSDVGSRYQISADGGPWRPDPASRRLPDGVHGASEVVKRLPALPKWPGRALSELVFYELHIGTFTDEGTFEAAIAHLDDLAALGVTAVELMPIAEVPGRPTRNWGYDGVQLFAVRESYGGAPGLRAFVRACRARGLAVVVDVVYNHLGPEGNYLGELGGWFNDTYRTPWGPAVNLDGAHSDGVRTHLLAHAREMLIEHGADGLRLDSCPNLFDRSPLPFLE